MKENVVLILTDDQTINTIGCQGNNEIITPNIDKLCEEGLFFDNCHIQGGTSGALCMPSRAMINTSKNIFELKDAGNTIPDDHPLLGEVFQKNGYNTFFTGKWHNGIDGFYRSFNNGANIFFGGMWDHYNVPMNDFDPTGEYDNKVKYVIDFLNSNETLEMRANKFNPGRFSSEVITESAINFIESYQDDKPFYLNVAYLAPHDPRIVEKKYLDMYDNIEVSLFKNFCDEHPFNFGQEIERDETLASRPLNKEWVRAEIKTYYAMITQLDEHLGSIVAKLKEKGIYDNTTIIFTSDNGISLSAHGLMGKQNLYDESIRIPFVIKGTGIRSGQISNRFIQLQDIFPTLVERLELSIDDRLDGYSFARELCESSESQRNEIYLVYTDLIRGLKDKDYKLIYYKPKGEEEVIQLFNLKNDPLELNDIAHDKVYEEVKQEYLTKLLDLKIIYENENNVFSQNFWNRNKKV